MKNGWQYKKVSEIAKHSLGKMLDKQKNKGDLRPYLRNLNVRWFDFDLSDVSEMRFLPEEAVRYAAVRGDVLICEGGYPGRAAIWEQDAPIYFQKALHRVRFHEPERAKWFLYYLLSKDLDGTLKDHFSGTGIQHFTGEVLAQFQVPLPPLPEQQRIVGILDEAFSGIAPTKANTEKNLQNARAIYKSHLRSVFTLRGEGWLEKTLGDLCEVFADGDWVESKDQSQAGIRLIQTGNVGAGFFKDRSAKARYISEATFKRLRCTEIFEGDCLISRLPDPVGRCCILPDTGERMITAVDCTIVRFDLKQLLPNFFNHYAQSGSYISAVSKKCTGTTRNRISRSNLALIPIPVPSLSEQKRLTAELDVLREETQRLEFLCQRKLAALDALKQSLLHQAFSGQL